MTPADVLREIAEREISLVPVLGGRVWTAIVEQRGDTIATKSRKVRSVLAQSSTPQGAVAQLVALLDAKPDTPATVATEEMFRRYAPDFEPLPF